MIAFSRDDSLTHTRQVPDICPWPKIITHVSDHFSLERRQVPAWHLVCKIKTVVVLALDMITVGRNDSLAHSRQVSNIALNRVLW